MGVERSRGRRRGQETGQGWAAGWSELRPARAPGRELVALREGIGNRRALRLLRGQLREPMDLYLLHLLELARERGLELEELLPGAADPSWLAAIEPYYRVLWAERLERERGPLPRGPGQVEAAGPPGGESPGGGAVRDTAPGPGSPGEAGALEAGWGEGSAGPPGTGGPAPGTAGEAAGSAPAPGNASAGEGIALSRLEREGGTPLELRDPAFEAWFRELLEAAGAGRSLDEEEQALLERVHGRRFPGLRVHENAAAGQAARAVGAAAFTLGRDVYLGPAPAGSPERAELLAHEATHVKQAGEGRLPEPRGVGIAVSRPGEPHEREAERAGREGRRAWMERSRAGRDAWGLARLDRGDPRYRAVLERLEAELPPPDTHPPRFLLREGVARWLDRELAYRRGRLAGLARGGRLAALGGPRRAEEAGWMPALEQRLEQLEAERRGRAERAGDGDLRWYLAHLPAPTEAELEAAGRAWAPYPSFAEDAAGLLRGLDGGEDGRGAGRSPLEQGPLLRQGEGSSPGQADEPGDAPVRVLRGQASSAGWKLVQRDGKIAVVRQGQLEEHGHGFDKGVQATLAKWEQGGSVYTASTGSGQDVFSASASGTGYKLEGTASAGYGADGFEVSVEGGASVFLADGKLILQTPELGTTVLGETLKARFGVELSAAVVAEAKGKVGARLGTTGDGFEAGLGGELGGFAGAKAGIKAFAYLKWRPRAVGTLLDVAGLSLGAEGWAGAAAAVKLDANLWPSIEATFSVGAALGLGGGLSAKLEVQAENAALFMLTMAGRGAAVGLDAIGATWLARAMDTLVTDMYDDDAARAAVEHGVHKQLDVQKRCRLIDRMLAGACGDADEQAILTVLRDAKGSGELHQLVTGVSGGALRMLEKFDGEEYTQLLTLLYVRSGLDDVPIDDDVARALVARGLHTSMTVLEARRMVNAMLDGFTGNADEQAILRVMRERPDFAEVFTHDLRQRCVEAFDGEERDALVGFLFLHGLLEGAELDDDAARAVIRQGMHLAVNDTTLLQRLLEELLEDYTGDDDEAAIVRLLLDKPAFTLGLSDRLLAWTLEDVDGEEHDQLLVALRKAGRIRLDDEQYEVDDDTARVAVAMGLHTSLGVEENRRLVDELLDGFTGNDDEHAILRILVDNRSQANAILATDARKRRVLGNMHGDEYDDALAIYAFEHILPDIEIDDDVARGAVRLGLHTSVQDGATLWELIEALLDGYTGDDDEQAILRILRECPQVRGQLNEGRLQLLAKAIDGEEYEDFVVWARSERVLPSLAVDWLSLRAHVARAVIDRVSLDELSLAEMERLLDALDGLYTWEGDQDRVLRMIWKRPQLVQRVGIERVVGMVDGEDRVALFVLLYQQGLLPTNPLPEKFDDDAARRFVDLGYHRDQGKFSRAACRQLAQAMVTDFTGDADEARLIQLLRDRPDTVEGSGDSLLDNIIRDTDGEELNELFELLYVQHRLQVSPLHPDFDDDVARYFVEKGYHRDTSTWTTDACTGLLERLKSGWWTGDAEERAVIRLLRDRVDVLLQLDDGTVDALIDVTQGEERSWLMAELWEHDKLELPHEGFNDTVARHFVSRGFHRRMDARELEEVLDAMLGGYTSEADQEAILRVLREAPAALGALDDERVNWLLEDLDGRDYDELLIFLYEKGKVDVTDRDLELDDDAARLFVDRGLHRKMSRAELRRLLEEMLAGVTGDEDEDRILAVLRERWDAVGMGDQQLVARLLWALDGEQYDRLLGLLWDHEALPEGMELNDRVARGIVLEGRYQGRSLDELRRLLDALLAGYTGGGDEQAVLQLLEGRSDLVASLDGGEIDALYDNLHGESESRLLLLLFEAGRIELGDKRFDDDAARLLVQGGHHRELDAGQLGLLVQKLLSGFCSDEDERAILTILESRPGQLEAILSSVSLEQLVGGFQRGNYHRLVALLYANGFRRAELLEEHVNEDCAVALVESGLAATMPPADRGRLLSVLVEAGGSRAGRAVIRLFEQDTASIAAVLQGVGLGALESAFPDAERAYLLALVFQHVPSLREDVLRSLCMDRAAAIKLARMRLYQGMSAEERALLVNALLLAGEQESLNYAYEVLCYCHELGPGPFEELVQGLGGADALRARFKGPMAADVDELLGEPG